MTEPIFFLTCMVPFLVAFFAWRRYKDSVRTFLLVMVVSIFACMCAAGLLGWIINDNLPATFGAALAGLAFLLPGFVLYYGGAAVLGWLAAVLYSRIAGA